MSEPIHHDPSSIVHYDLPDERIKFRTISFGALCIVLLAATGFFGYKLSERNAAVAAITAQLERANEETAGVKADLAKANATSADLRSQLDQATHRQGDLQAEMNKTQQAGSALQTQLDQAKADWHSLQEKTQSQTAEFQAQVNQANATSTGLRQELAAAKSQIDDLKAQLAKAKDDAAKLTPPTVPVRALPLTTDFKKSLFGSTSTLQIKNPSNDALKLDIQITGSDKTPSRTATIEGGGSLKIEGLAAGANVVIASDGFGSQTVTAP